MLWQLYRVGMKIRRNSRTEYKHKEWLQLTYSLWCHHPFLSCTCIVTYTFPVYLDNIIRVLVDCGRFIWVLKITIKLSSSPRSSKNSVNRGWKR